MDKKHEKINRLIISNDHDIIANRFVVKVSIFDNGIDKKSTMLVILDLLENNFKIHFYNTLAEAEGIIKILNRVNK